MNAILTRIAIALQQFSFASSTGATVFSKFAKSLDKLRSQLMWIIGPLGAIALVVAGIFWLVPGIDDDKKKTAKGIFFGVAIGLAVTILAPTIVYTISDLFGNTSVNANTVNAAANPTIN